MPVPISQVLTVIPCPLLHPTTPATILALPIISHLANLEPRYLTV